MTFIDLQKAEEEARKAKEEEEKRKKKEEERARRRARGLEDEEEQEEEEKKEGEGDEEEQKEGEETEEEQHREPGEIIKGFYYGKKDKFWVSMVGFVAGCLFNVQPQEPITRSVQLPCLPYASGFSQIELFLASFLSTFPRESGSTVSSCVRTHSTIILQNEGVNANKTSEILYFLISSFWWLIYKTYLMFKIRGKIDLI